MFGKNRKAGKQNRSTHISKGDRMGWVSLHNVKEVRLSTVLSEGKVVSVNNQRESLLVP